MHPSDVTTSHPVPALSRPNVVLVLTDDQGYGDLGCHGNPILKTPHLDRLHADSVRLTDYHVGPTCAPTRAGLMTGHYANSTGVWHTIGGRSLLRQHEVSMADFFRHGGYRTGLFGKWHLGDNVPYRPQDRGFDNVVTHGGGGVGQTPDYWGNNYVDDVYWTGSAFRKFAGYCTEVWFREAMRFIDANRDRPFFCYIPTNAPHSPHIVPPAYSEPYLAATPHRDRANYYGMVSNIDANVGVLRAFLEEIGLSHDTIFIFMTDNGSGGGLEVDADNFVTSGFNAGMRGKKNSEYDGGHRVPCFIHWPAGGLTGGRDVTRLSANVDLLPTLMDLCNLGDPAQHDFDGRSLAPLLHNPEVEWPDRIMVTDSQRLAYPIKWRKSAVMTDRWRLVNGEELYDMAADPGQREDVAAARPDLVDLLRAGYEAWWEKVSRQFDAEIPIPLGGDEHEVLLTTHDWRNEECECAWNQSLIRQGIRCNGYWEVDVVHAGRYRFELRRWPREEDIPLTAGLPGEPVPFEELTALGGYGGGSAIPVQSASIRIAGMEATRQLAFDTHAVCFELELPAGPAHLQTHFAVSEDDSLGAYYVYVSSPDLYGICHSESEHRAVSTTAR